MGELRTSESGAPRDFNSIQELLKPWWGLFKGIFERVWSLYATPYVDSSLSWQTSEPLLEVTRLCNPQHYEGHAIGTKEIGALEQGKFTTTMQNPQFRHNFFPAVTRTKGDLV